ncbi:MAG: cyanophycinase [Acidobacteria bacterium]|nr:cyanophycinase [Acidobacteriota bacterium]
MNHRFRFKLKFCAVFLLLAAAAAAAQQRLVLIGGGDRPAAALAWFVEWAGGKEKARILIVTWASGVPAESFESLKDDFAKYPAQSLDHAPDAPLDDAKRARFLEQLKTATGVFFSGGDQNRIMDVLKDEELYNALRAKYDAGAVFGGTSAGTALMSSPMMTGENDLTVIDAAKVGTRKGLGLLPNAIVDQHFVKRQRENRLFGLLLANPQMLGVGIDEDTALLVADNRTAEVAGATYVMFVDASDKKATFKINLLKPGERYDLVKRKRISKK